MQLKIDLPADLFDREFTEEAFKDRIRELAILELVRLKRLHEHEALSILALERVDLVEKMKAVGIAPTEAVFNEIRGELLKAIEQNENARRKP